MNKICEPVFFLHLHSHFMTSVIFTEWKKNKQTTFSYDCRTHKLLPFEKYYLQPQGLKQATLFIQRAQWAVKIDIWTINIVFDLTMLLNIRSDLQTGLINWQSRSALALHRNWVMLAVSWKKNPTNNSKVWFHLTKLLSYKFEQLASSILHLKVSLIDIFNSLEIKR